MIRKQKIALIVLLVVLMTLSGCGIKSSHVNAIKDAIVEYTDYYLEVEDLAKQIRKQGRGLTGYEDGMSYTLDIRVPDYSLIDVNQIQYEIPAIDWSNPDSDLYLESIGDSIRRSVEAYALSNPMEGYVDTTMTVDVKLNDGKWIGAISSKSQREIAALVDGMIQKKAAEINELPKEYDYVRVAEQMDGLIATLVEPSSYTDAIVATGVDDLGGGQYRLNFSYPDPSAAFATLGDAFVASQTERIFGSVDCTLNPDDLDAAGLNVSSKAGSITVSMDNSGVCSIVDGQAFADDYAAALSDAEASAAEAAAEQYGVPAVALPTSSAVLYGTSTGSAEFRVTLSGLAPATYFRLYKVNSSTSEAGTLQIGFYVLSNSRMFTVDIPAGTYKLVFSWGDAWYGPEYMFGPDGSYMYLETTIELEDGWYMKSSTNTPWGWYDDVLNYDYGVDISL